MFELILTNGKEDLTLPFTVRSTDIAKKWFLELKKDYPLYETTRFSDWGDYKVIDEINQCIDIINQYDFVIDEKVSITSDQHTLNYLHKFFEDLRGEITIGTDWFNSAPTVVKESVERFNVLIHRLEAEIRTKGKHPTVVVTFKDSTRFELTDNDCQHFTYRWSSRTVYINYCQVGKTVLDVFKDRDEVAEAIRPQTHYSADFMIKFGPTVPYWIYYFRSILLKIWLRKKHFSFKNLNLGMIPVADLAITIDNSALLKFNKVKEIKCIK
jgi:hypothetical protein